MNRRKKKKLPDSKSFQCFAKRQQQQRQQNTVKLMWIREMIWNRMLSDITQHVL